MLQTGLLVRWDTEWSTKRETRPPDPSRGLMLGVGTLDVV